MFGCPVEIARVAMDVVRAGFVGKRGLTRNCRRLRKPKAFVLTARMPPRWESQFGNGEKTVVLVTFGWSIEMSNAQQQW